MIEIEFKDITCDNGFPANIDMARPIFIFYPDKEAISTQPCVMYTCKRDGLYTRSYLKNDDMIDSVMYCFNVNL